LAGAKSFSNFKFNSIQVPTSEIHIYLNIAPKSRESVLLDSYFCALSSKNTNPNSGICLDSVSFDSCIKLNQINNVCISSHIGPIIGGVFLKEEKVEHEISGGPQAPCCEELNPVLEQGKPWCI
jgi:hypothetical protein